MEAVKFKIYQLKAVKFLIFPVKSSQAEQKFQLGALKFKVFPIESSPIWDFPRLKQLHKKIF